MIRLMYIVLETEDTGHQRKGLDIKGKLKEQKNGSAKKHLVVKSLQEEEGSEKR